MFKSFPHYPQLDAMDCGATCLRMISKYYGKSYTNQTLREKSMENILLSSQPDRVEYHSVQPFGL
jgi:ATP-binding cassette subfamily B protein